MPLETQPEASTARRGASSPALNMHAGAVTESDRAMYNFAGPSWKEAAWLRN